MARQTGSLKITGTFNGILFYEMQGGYFARKASSLTASRFKKDKAFENSRRSSQNFSNANRLATEVYRMSGKEKRNIEVYRLLLKTAMALFQQGKEEVFIRQILLTTAGF